MKRTDLKLGKSTKNKQNCKISKGVRNTVRKKIKIGEIVDHNALC